MRHGASGLGFAISACAFRVRTASRAAEGSRGERRACLRLGRAMRIEACVVCEFAGRRFGLNLSPYLRALAESIRKCPRPPRGAQNVRRGWVGKVHWSGGLDRARKGVAAADAGTRRRRQKCVLSRRGARQNCGRGAAPCKSKVLSLSAGLCCWRCLTAHEIASVKIRA